MSIGDHLKQLRRELGREFDDLEGEVNQKDVHGVLKNLFQMQALISSCGARIADRFEKRGTARSVRRKSPEGGAQSSE